MKEYTVELVLTGANKGRTCLLHGMQFVDGKSRFTGSAEAVNGRVIYMRRCHGAHPKGSDELIEAQRVEQEQANGIRDPLRQTGVDTGRPDSIPYRPTDRHGVELAGGLTELSEDFDPANPEQGQTSVVGDHSGQARILSDRSGLAHARVHEGTSEGTRESANPLTSAVMSLDPMNDDHWTPDGRPSVSALAEMLDNPKLGRKDVDAVGRWTRKDAQEVLESEIPV